ncbi:MAG: SDR family oxidoreductase [Ignavibacteriales bacterium]|jgi:NADP-dependent 3-hydroxy acid dehydrogenase YdfG|nr:SDR family oxidoreductase [Ignavibacteriales bacterium]MBP9123994.1 SDR family oxidoreductase [Ignavibacteriaceae bacterium]
MKIWVSGASSGIGKAIVNEALAKGLSVVATSRDAKKLQLLSNELNSGALVVSQCDVSDSKSVEEFYKKTFSSEGPDALVNSAGITVFKNAAETSIAEVDGIIKTNLLGSVYAIHSVLPSMISKKQGTIINISSVAAIKVLKGSSIYSATKAGLLQYSRVLREEVREHNIKVIDVLPGATETPIWDEKVRNRHKDRMMKPEDVAAFVVELLTGSGNMVAEEIVLRPVTGDL